METIIRLKSSELDAVFIEKVKALFVDNDVEITLSFSERGIYDALSRTQPKQDYRKIDRSIENVEQGKNIISFTGDEFEKMVKMLEGK